MSKQPNAYSSLASVYDALNSGVDYKAWADRIEEQFRLYSDKKPESILDLACGTGTMTVEFAKRGYDMTGVDLSEEMLSEARAKCDAERFPHSVLLVRQDMRELELYGTVDAVICCLDSLNYLTDSASLGRTFSHVFNYLNPGGLFIFDMNAPAKFEKTYGENAYVIEDEGILCAWQNFYNKKSKLCDFYLSIFRERGDGLWERFDEEQRERCYSLRLVKKLLAESGFEVRALTDDAGNEVGNDTERWHFTVKKPD